MSVATFGMCYFSYRNIKITKKETIKQDLQNEIEYLSYSAMCYVRNDIEVVIKIKIELLRYYIAMFLLKKKEVCEQFDCCFI